MTEGIPSGGETATVGAETATAEVSEVETVVPEKCIPPFVLTAVLRPRFRSNLLKGDQFTAETAFQNTGSSELKDSKKFQINFITGSHLERLPILLFII
jgi:hypothetical protein